MQVARTLAPISSGGCVLFAPAPCGPRWLSARGPARPARSRGPPWYPVSFFGPHSSDAYRFWTVILSFLERARLAPGAQAIRRRCAELDGSPGRVSAPCSAPFMIPLPFGRGPGVFGPKGGACLRPTKSVTRVPRSRGACSPRSSSASRPRARPSPSGSGRRLRPMGTIVRTRTAEPARCLPSRSGTGWRVPATIRSGRCATTDRSTRSRLSRRMAVGSASSSTPSGAC
jgi:hypothetical protein